MADDGDFFSSIILIKHLSAASAYDMCARLMKAAQSNAIPAKGRRRLMIFLLRRLLEDAAIIFIFENARHAPALI